MGKSREAGTRAKAGAVEKVNGAAATSREVWSAAHRDFLQALGTKVSAYSRGWPDYLLVDDSGNAYGVYLIPENWRLNYKEVAVLRVLAARLPIYLMKSGARKLERVTTTTRLPLMTTLTGERR